MKRDSVIRKLFNSNNLRKTGCQKTIPLFSYLTYSQRLTKHAFLRRAGQVDLREAAAVRQSPELHRQPCDPRLDLIDEGGPAPCDPLRPQAPFRLCLRQSPGAGRSADADFADGAYPRTPCGHKPLSVFAFRQIPGAGRSADAD